MPLISLWESNPAAITEMKIDQIVSTAGDGKLRDDSICSTELRTFLSQVSGEQLFAYAEHCLTDSFQKSGLVLQDAVNELGRRLDYKVENGRYQGVGGGTGYDGIWRSPEAEDVIIEVKTTDAYRISLDSIAEYRSKLQDSGKAGNRTSILIVVGREDTGELEAQVRGSRHAWDMRLISVDSLVKLVRLKESTEAGITAAKIRSILVPLEFTRLDALVDVMFTTAKEVETAAEIEMAIPPDNAEVVPGEGSGWQFTDPVVLRSKREIILPALGRRDGKKLIKRSIAQYWDATHTYRVACTLSKRSTKKGSPPYWYAYHPAWNRFLAEGETSSFVLGCVDLDITFVLPHSLVREHLDEFNTTAAKEDSEMYWHIKIYELQPNMYTLQLPKSGKQLPLAPYELNLM